MYLNNDELRYCLDRAVEISEQYKLKHIASDDPRKSVDNLIVTCKDYLNKTVELAELAISKNDSSVWGSYIALPDKYDICYVEDLNFCWKRFVICKEVFHVILEKEDYKNMNLFEHIEQVTIVFPDNESHPSNSVACEWLAEIAAMEFMIPYDTRKKQIERYGENINYRDIAERFKVPLVLVEKYFSEQVMEVLSEFF